MPHNTNADSRPSFEFIIIVCQFTIIDIRSSLKLYLWVAKLSLTNVVRFYTFTYDKRDLLTTAKSRRKLYKIEDSRLTNERQTMEKYWLYTQEIQYHLLELQGIKKQSRSRRNDLLRWHKRFPPYFKKFKWLVSQLSASSVATPFHVVHSLPYNIFSRLKKKNKRIVYYEEIL